LLDDLGSKSDVLSTGAQYQRHTMRHASRKKDVQYLFVQDKSDGLYAQACERACLWYGVVIGAILLCIAELCIAKLILMKIFFVALPKSLTLYHFYAETA
jgi:hypothetical protein